MDRAVILAHVPAALIHAPTTATLICSLRLTGCFGLALEQRKEGKKTFDNKLIEETL